MSQATLRAFHEQEPNFAVVPTKNPFPGLRPFEEYEAEFFFGREVHIEALLKKLHRRRLLAVVGNSGSGKSSLVLAGVLPRLHRGYPGLGGSCWRVARMRPGNDPLGNLATALQLAHEENDEDEFVADQPRLRNVRSVVDRDVLRAQIERSSEGLVDAARNLELAPDENLLLLVDQFEELFRFQKLVQRIHHDEAAAFVRLLMRGVEQRAVPLYVLLTMRSDFLGECVRFRGLAEALNEGQYLVPLLTRDERARAIRGPLGVAGADISSALLQHLLNDAGELDDQLPVLQHALMRTFDLTVEKQKGSRAAPRLELADYDTAGKMESALSKHADEAYESIGKRFGTEGKRTTELLFRCLTERGEHGQGMRRPCKISEVLAVTEAPLTTLTAILEEFVGKGRGFLTCQPPGEITPETTLDISHESLMRKWGRLKDWTADEVAFRRQLAELHEAQRGYANRTKGLLRDPELSLALKWRSEQRPTGATARRYEVDLNALDEFLRKSSSVARLRAWTLWSTVLFTIFVLGIFGLVAAQQRRQARVALEEARTARLVRLARELNQGSILIGSFLREAVQKPPDRIRAWHATASAMTRKRWSLELKGHTGWVVAASFSNDGRRVVTASYDNTARIWDTESGKLIAELKGHTGWVVAASFSYDGRRALTAADDSTARVWDSESGRLIVELKGHTDSVVTASFSYDGRHVVTASHDNTARIWDADSGKLIAELKGHTGWVVAASFSNDGRHVVTASSDHIARVWDADSGRLIAELKGHTGWVVAASFSNDGRHVVTGSRDHTARVWDADSGKLTAELEGHTDSVVAASFSNDGRRVATASDDSTSRVWDSESGKLTAELKGHGGLVVAASFRNDGRHVVTASCDNTARIWDSLSGKLVAELEGHTGSVVGASFSNDGRHVITASRDNTARIWDTDAGTLTAELEGHTDSVVAASFSNDGRHVVSASNDKTARVWDSDSGKLIAELRGHIGPVAAASFSSDGRRIVTASRDSTARVWDSESAELTAELKGHTDPVVAASFSNDGRRIVTASSDKTARVWDSDSGTVMAELKGHTDSVVAASFSNDGRRVVTASLDDTARVWDSDSGTVMAELKGHTDSVVAVSISSDGKRVLTASLDNTARVWDSDSGIVMAELKGHTDSVVAASFSSDGRRVVTASYDNTARVWDSSTGKFVTRLTGHTGWVVAASFSNDGRRVVTTSYDNTARVWDSESGKRIAELEGHTDSVVAAAFSNDGHRIVTASADWSAGLWQADGRTLRFLGHGSAPRRAVVRERDGHQVAEIWNEYALVWRDLRTAFWQLLPFCLGEEQRQETLLETPEQARLGYQRCRETVEACRNTSFEACDKVVNRNYAPPR